MRTVTRYVFLILCAAVVVGCGESNERPAPADVAANVDAAITEETGAEASTSVEPCEVLTDDLLRSSFEIAEGAEITRAPSKYSRTPLCTASWDKPNAAELEQRRSAEMSDYLQRKMRGEDVKMPSFRTTNEVSLTIYEPAFDDAEAAVASFDASMKRLAEGVTGSHEGTEVTFQSDLDPVDGVGSKAMWSARMRQLSVVDGNRIFHLTVNTGAETEQDLAKAREVAARVAEAL